MKQEGDFRISGVNERFKKKNFHIDEVKLRIKVRNHLMDAGKSRSRGENSHFDGVKQRTDAGNIRFIEKEQPEDGKITAPAAKNRESQGQMRLQRGKFPYRFGKFAATGCEIPE